MLNWKSRRLLCTLFDLRRKRHEPEKSPRFRTEDPQSDCSGHGHWFDNLSQSISSRGTDSEHFCRQEPPFYGPPSFSQQSRFGARPKPRDDAQGSQRKPGPHPSHSLSLPSVPPPPAQLVEYKFPSSSLPQIPLLNFSCRTEIDPIGCFLAHIHLLTLPLQDLASSIF